MNRVAFFLIPGFFIALFVMAASDRPKAIHTASNNALEKALKRYSSARSVVMDLEKIVHLKVLEREERYTGKAYMGGKDLLKLEFKKPAHSVAVLNKQRAWVIEYPPEDFDEPVRVTKFPVGRQSQLLVTSILGKGTLLDMFRVNKQVKSSSHVIYELSPAKKLDDIRSLEISLNEKQEITQLSYVDALENKTTFKFDNIRFDVRLKKDLFEYRVPKGAEVNEF